MIDENGHDWVKIDFNYREYCLNCKCVRTIGAIMLSPISCSDISKMMESHCFGFVEKPVLRHNSQNVICKDCKARTALFRFNYGGERHIGYLKVIDSCSKLRMRRALNKPGTIYGNPYEWRKETRHKR